jgi:hypothetical protein
MPLLCSKYAGLLHYVCVQHLTFIEGRPPFIIKPNCTQVDTVGCMHKIRQVVEGYLTNSIALPPEAAYSKEELPITSMSKSALSASELDGRVDIHHSTHFLHVDDINQSKGTISLSIMFETVWFIPIVLDYTTVPKSMHPLLQQWYFAVSPSLMWTPDLGLHNGVETGTGTAGNLVPGGSDKLAIIFNQYGKPFSMVARAQFGQITTSCRFFLKNFPFDKQTCDVLVGSRLRPSVFLGINTGFFEDFRPHLAVNYTDFQHTEWTISNISYNRYTAKLFDVDFDAVSYSIQMQRNSRYYISMGVLPLVIVSFICILGVFNNNLEHRLNLAITGKAFSYTWCSLRKRHTSLVLTRRITPPCIYNRAADCRGHWVLHQFNVAHI